MLSRRKFFAILAVGAGLAGTWSIGRTLVPDDKEVVRMLLDKELSYLKVDVKEYHRFAEDILSEPHYGKAVGMLPISVLPLDMLPRLLIPAALVHVYS